MIGLETIIFYITLKLVCSERLVNVSNNDLAVNHRQSRFWGIGVVRFENSICKAANGLDGTCYTRKQCRNLDGIISGRCAGSIGVCCVIQANCGETSSENNTYFINNDFPGSFVGASICTLTIEKDTTSNICQIRIDLLSFVISQPNADGVCNTDSLIIVGGSAVPIICGENTGQHLYVDFNGDANIKIIVSTKSLAALARIWKIKVAQIGCDCSTRAPNGCLQYHTTLTGTVSSFNYGLTISSEVTPGGNLPGTRQLANHVYGVCVAARPGYCRIRWSQDTATDRFSFTVTGGTIGLTGNNMVGMVAQSEQGTTCLTDYVMIANGVGADVMPGVDRYCGNAFPTVTTSSKPFVLNVVTDGNEGMIDNGNRGFMLQFTQLRCDTPLLF